MQLYDRVCFVIPVCVVLDLVHCIATLWKFIQAARVSVCVCVGGGDRSPQFFRVALLREYFACGRRPRLESMPAGHCGAS